VSRSRAGVWICGLAISCLGTLMGHSPAVGQLTLDGLTEAFEAGPLYTVGRLDGQGCDVFGRIADAVISEQGRLYVLDAVWHRVSVITDSGSCIQSIGREGNGPGEFAQPERLLHRRDTLYVLDPGNARIERFQTGAGELVHLPSIPLPVRAVDMCFLGERLYLISPSEEHSVHEIDLAGRLRQSFGRMEESGDPTLRVVHQAGRLRCHDAGNVLVVAARQMPHVHIYSSEGERRSQGVIPGFEPMELVIREGRIIGFRPGLWGFDYTVSILALDRAQVLIQFGSPTEVGYQSTYQVLLNLETGVFTRHERGPHIFAVEANWLVVSVADDLVPRLAVYRTQP